MPSSRVRLVRLDGDEKSSDESSDKSGIGEKDRLSTSKLLERLVVIDDACFPNDAGGLASARTLASSQQLRRVTRLAVVYEEAEPSERSVTQFDSAERTSAFDSPTERSSSETQSERTSKSDSSMLVAFASYTASSMCFEVNKVACAPSFRRRGHARRALAAILDEAKRRKIKRVALRVEKTNAAAVSLYESLGFTEDVSRARAHEGYYGAGRHGAVYEYLL